MEEENDFLGSLGDIFVSGLGRAVDNATAQEPQPSPDTQTRSDRVVVTTSQDETGRAKVAGTGQILPGVSNKYLALGVGGVAVLTVLLFAMRR